MPLLWSNNASTTVAGSITPATTSVNLAAGTGAEFPSPSAGNYFKATFYDQATKTQFEIVHVTARVGDVCTIVRGQEGTTAQNWNAGDIFANLVTAGTLSAFVQAGTGPADTSVVYVGTDVSGTPNLVVAATNPVPAAYAVGMMFNILIANTNTGPVSVQFNGLASVPATRSDGSPMVGGNIVVGQETTFVYNGTTFNAIGIRPIPQAPPQTVFYVRTDGNDNNSGFANTPAGAFKTIYGAINNIKARYISQNTITVRVADGSYLGGFGDTSSYIASWNIVGNTANPGNVLVDATPTVPPAGATAGFGCVAGGSAIMTVNGFTFKSYYGNIGTSGSGVLSAFNCNYTTPVVAGGYDVISCAGGTLFVAGTSIYTGTAPAACLFGVAGGSASFGFVNDYYSQPGTMNLQGTCNFGAGTVAAAGNGVFTLVSSAASFTGLVPTGRKYNATTGGGINVQGGGTASTAIPGSLAGTFTPPGWVNP